MSDEAAFLAALAASPADPLPRLAYADWLEERADPRHELIRVCEAMRQVPVFSDEYWRLKARRNELRPAFPADWLAATGCDGSRYDAIFRDGVPDGWRERWRLICEFTERWHGVPMPDVGGRAAEIAATEERLGLTLPPSVREWVAFALDALRGTHGAPMRDGFNGLRLRPDHGMVQLLIQAEGDLIWAVRNEELTIDNDPPVYLLYLDYEADRPAFRGAEDGILTPTVTGFAFDYLMSYLWVSSRESACEWSQYSSDDAATRHVAHFDGWHLIEHMGEIISHADATHPRTWERTNRFEWSPPTPDR